jgi:hypothetical protein
LAKATHAPQPTQMPDLMTRDSSLRDTDKAMEKD